MPHDSVYALFADTVMGPSPQARALCGLVGFPQGVIASPPVQLSTLTPTFSPVSVGNDVSLMVNFPSILGELTMSFQFVLLVVPPIPHSYFRHRRARKASRLSTWEMRASQYFQWRSICKHRYGIHLLICSFIHLLSPLGTVSCTRC